MSTASYPERPLFKPDGSTPIRGLYLAGELAGLALIKQGLNAGHALGLKIADELEREPPAPDPLDLIVVGVGAAGLAALTAAASRGLRVLGIDAAEPFQTVRAMTRGKRIYAEPQGVETKSPVWFQECNREELLERWQAHLATAKLEVRSGESVLDVKRDEGRDELRVETTSGVLRARRVVLAVGRASTPRKAGVPGEREQKSRIHHRLADAAEVSGQAVFIYGSGDVACEAALALCDRNKVVLATIEQKLEHAQRKNAEALHFAARSGRLELLLGTRLVSVGERTVSLQSVAPTDLTPPTERPADRVYEMIGGELPTALLQKIGVPLEGTWTGWRYLILGLVFLVVHALYALKSYGDPLGSWPYGKLIAPGSYDAVLRTLFDLFFTPFAWVFSDEALQHLRAQRGFQQGYVYSSIYTLVVIGFGYEAMVRWKSRHQYARYATLLLFQVGTFLCVNIVGVRAVGVETAWRGWAFTLPWPLSIHNFSGYGSETRLWKWICLGVAFLWLLVLIPWLARRHGKRFCTWVCGCGGLAETLGDRWRHLAPKGEKSRSWEFISYVVLLAAVLVTLVTVSIYRGSTGNLWFWAYNALVNFWLVAVIPIAAYPFFGGKIWCRYFCPLAAYNQLLARRIGRLQIVSNERCISCTECSRHCQVGIDVMSFARQQEPLDNRNSSCIQCGICIEVCPMDVLSFSRK